MICQLCLVKEATRHFVGRTPQGVIEECDYCDDCYRVKLINRPHIGRVFRPRFTLRTMMILIAVCALPNAVLA